MGCHGRVFKVVEVVVVVVMFMVNRVSTNHHRWTVVRRRVGGPLLYLFRRCAGATEMPCSWRGVS